MMSLSVHAQMGVNTPIANSTLTVDGSFSAKYTEVKVAFYEISESDYNIAYTGNRKGNFTLPEVKRGKASIAGRMYYIKNMTKDHELVIKGVKNQEFRFGGTIGENNEINLFGGQYIVLIANNTGGKFAWDINMLGQSDVLKLPEIRTIEYIRKTVPINVNTPKESIVKIGNLEVRFNGTSSVSDSEGYIEYRSVVPTHTTSWYTKTGSGASNQVLSCYGQQTVYPNSWNKMCVNYGAVTNNISAFNRDSSVAYVTLSSTKDVYRITSNINGIIYAGVNNVSKVNPQVTLFVEKLD